MTAKLATPNGSGHSFRDVGSDVSIGGMEYPI